MTSILADRQYELAFFLNLENQNKIQELNKEIARRLFESNDIENYSTEFEHSEKVIAEMGGKNAIIVDDDADLDTAVLNVLYSAFGFQGQKCSACSRVIVVNDIYDKFTARLVEAAGSIRLGPAEDPAAIEFMTAPPMSQINANGSNHDGVRPIRR